MSRQIVFNLVKSLPDSELIALIEQAPRTLLTKLREVVFGDCNCNWQILPCPEHGEKCDCVVSRERIAPCAHWIFYEQTQHVFSEDVRNALIQALEPRTWHPSRSYTDPPEPDVIREEIAVMQPRIKANVMAARLSRGKSLWSRFDFLKRPAVADELQPTKIVREVKRLGNGAERVGSLTL